MAVLRSQAAVMATTLLLFSFSSNAFAPAPRCGAGRGVEVRTSTTLNLFDFFNEGKKALVKKIAGNYDALAIQARIDGLIKNNKVLMLSFTT